LVSIGGVSLRAKDGVVERLNNILTIELTAINQYFVQSEMCKNWGFNRIASSLRSNSLEEMKDAQELIQHILYLEGVPNLQRINQVMVGESVLEDLELDLRAEMGAVETLTEAIAHCAQVQDFTTRSMLEEMVRSEETHVDWIETQLETIKIIGIDLYLNQQIHGD
jgi:bacterioferritin